MPTNVFVCVFIFKEVKGKVFVFFFPRNHFMETDIYVCITFLYPNRFLALCQTFVFEEHVTILFYKNSLHCFFCAERIVCRMWTNVCYFYFVCFPFCFL